MAQGENSERANPLTTAMQVVKPSNALLLLLLLAVIYTVYFAKGLLIPIVLAVFLSILFAPLVSRLSRYGIPRAISAAVLVASMVMVVAGSLYMLAEPAEEWLRDAPRSVRQLKNQTAEAQGKIADIKELAEEVGELTKVESGKKQEAQPVVVQNPSALEQMMDYVPLAIAGSVVVVFLTFFILVGGDTLLLKITRFGRTWGERRRIVCIARHIQSELSRYLTTVTLINVTLGVVTGVALHLLEVPNPVMWGTVVGVLNFAPYVGALASVLLLTVVGLTTFPDLADALLVPLVFLFLTILEGQLITPTVVGRNLAISPMMVLLSVIIWGWLWGVLGALMAVPILTSIKSICDHFPALNHIGDFMSSESHRKS